MRQPSETCFGAASLPRQVPPLRHVRLEYDLAGAMKRIIDAGLPRFLAERLQWGE